MRPSRHLVTSAAFSLALVPWLTWRSLLVLAGGALVDLDRYLWYVLRYRTFRPRPAIEKFQGRNRIEDGPRFLHSIEFLLLLFVGGFLYAWIWILGLGVLLHVALDLFVYKTRGQFFLRFDPSHFHCLALELLRKSSRDKSDTGGSATGDGQ
jgi:hypothetical protein